MLKDKIESDLKEAMKKGQALRVSTIRFLKADLVNAEIEKQKELTDEDIIAVIKRQIKQRQDSIEEFKKGNRQDLVDKESEESHILKGYLPEQMNEQEILVIVREAITEAGATSVKDMGKVMKLVMAKAAGRADGKIISGLVNKELSKDAGAA